MEQTPECYSCERNAVPSERLPAREAVYDDGHWRVAHAFSSSLAGWMVIVARRHILSLSEMTRDEAAALGPLIQRLSSALEAATGSAKCYVIFLAEAPGFSHVHIHVAPRLTDAPVNRVGIRAIEYLGGPESEWVTPTQMDRISTGVRELMLGSDSS
jgi:diadenosine tetraphosphate (Ap4A) HIT family hydrolase